MAVSASWSKDIQLCFRKGSPRRILLHKLNAIKALTGREVHALFIKEKERVNVVIKKKCFVVGN